MITSLPDCELSFDSESHVYTYRGFELPSVTQIMKPMSMMLYNSVPLESLYAASDRGTRAHEQVSNYVLYGIVEEDEDTKPYVDAFLEFENAYHPQWIASEYRTFHKSLMYAGTIDLVAYIEPDDGSGVDLIDLKCTSSFYSVMLSTQLGAYEEAIKSQGVPVRKTYGLQLLKNGKFRFERVSDGYKTFLHSLALHNAMSKELNS